MQSHAAQSAGLSVKEGNSFQRSRRYALLSQSTIDLMTAVKPGIGYADMHPPYFSVLGTSVRHRRWAKVLDWVLRCAPNQAKSIAWISWFVLLDRRSRYHIPRSSQATAREQGLASQRRRRSSREVALRLPEMIVHSITSSARVRTVSEMFKPRALAVLRLIMKSNFTGC